MANPFLMSDQELGDTQVSSNNGGFNPFLAGSDFSGTFTDNPFMNVFSNSNENTYESGNSTNPFAFGGETDSSANIYTTQVTTGEEINYENIFTSAPRPQSQVVNVFNDFTVTPESVTGKTGSIHDSLHDDSRRSSNTFILDTGDSLMGGDSGRSTPKSGVAPPRRPPPPRPFPPKETKELILSVTGAMEATSSDLLDRLQATRTPSPTPMRELHSPSPTQFGDLLEVDEPAPITTSHQQVPQSTEADLLGDFDLPAPTAPQPEVTQPPPDAFGDFGEPDPGFGEPSPQSSYIESNISGFGDVETHSAFEAATTQATLVEAAFGSSGLQEALGAPEEPFMDLGSKQTPLAPASVPSPVIPPSRPAPPAVPGRPKLPPQPARPERPRPVTQPPEPLVVQEPPREVAQPAEPLVTQEPPRPVAPPAEPLFAQEPSPLAAAEVNGFADVFGAAATELQPTAAIADPFAGFSAADPAAGDQASVDAFASFPPAEPAYTAAPPAVDAFSSFPSVEPVYASPAAPPPSATSVSPFDVFGAAQPTSAPANKTEIHHEDEFDAFTAKFESACLGDVKSVDPFDPFGSASFGQPAQGDNSALGFGAEDNFDSFLAIREPPPAPQGTPARVSRGESAESDGGNDFNIFIKPKAVEEQGGFGEASGAAVIAAPLAPPPRSPVQPLTLQDTSPRFNPFDSNREVPPTATENIFAQPGVDLGELRGGQLERTDSHETPPTPLFDEDVSQPLEDFPRIHYQGPGWEMQLRQPNKKKITGQRFWKKIFLRLVFQGENPVLQLFNNKDDKDPFQELPLQPCYSVSEIGAQQFDQYGKIFTVKLQFIFYKERPGVRPGQVTKAERITNKLSQFAAYAIQGDYQGVKEFGSDLKKLGLPVEHAPQISQLFKIGSHNYEDMKQFSMCVEEALFRLSAHRDRALNYKMEEVQITAVDELYVEQNNNGGVEKQIARVRLFFLGFLSGMPDVELGVNDLVRQGKEVVGRHDIIPVVTEEWIRLEGVEFHSCIQQDEYDKTRTIRFKPPDACYIELMRFRVRPPRNRELPLQLKCTMCVTGNKVEIHADILVPGFTSRKLGQIPCEDVMVRIPIPECWIYLFRVEKHFRYGSVKSAHRRTGKIKGIERILGAVENLETSLMETTSGQAKYEHQHKSIVWRMPRLPKDGQGAYTTHNLVCRLALTSYDQIPDELAKYCYVEFTMPATTVSHTTVRSVSIVNSDSDNPPEKYVRQLSRHEYRVEIEHTQGEGPGDYIAATVGKPSAPPPIPEAAPAPAQPESDSDSSG